MDLQVVIGASAVSCAGLLLWWAFFSDRRTDRARAALEESNRAFVAPTFRDLALAPGARERLVAPVGARVMDRVRRWTPRGSIEAMQRRINLAGAQRVWNVERLLAAKVLAALGTFLFFVLIAVATGSAIWGLASVILPIAAYVTPDGLLDRRARDRQSRIQDEMPDVIDQVMISVQAGLSFDAAIDRVASTGRGPFAEELRRVVQDVRLGLARTDALEKLAERTDVNELDEFIISMNQAESYGLSISQVLRVQSDELREKRRQRAEERAHKIPVKMVVPLIFCIFPTIFIAALGPAVIRAVNFDYNF